MSSEGTAVYEGYVRVQIMEEEDRSGKAWTQTKPEVRREPARRRF